MKVILDLITIAMIGFTAVVAACDRRSVRGAPGRIAQTTQVKARANT